MHLSLNSNQRRIPTLCGDSWKPSVSSSRAAATAQSSWICPEEPGFPLHYFRMRLSVPWSPRVTVAIDAGILPSATSLHAQFLDMPVFYTSAFAVLGLTVS